MNEDDRLRIGKGGEENRTEEAKKIRGREEEKRGLGREEKGMIDQKKRRV